MQHQRRRDRVEELTVIHPDNEVPCSRQLAHRLGAAPQQLEQVVGAHLEWDHPREGTQRHTRGAAHGLDPRGQRPLTLVLGQRLAREPGLPHPRRGIQDHSVRAIQPRLGDRFQLALPADDRPGPGGSQKRLGWR